MIEPIDREQQQRVISTTREYIFRAEEFYHRRFEMIPVNFDLKGRSTGMYRVQHGQREIRYNPYLFAKYFADNLAVTVPHEVAHYATDLIYGLRKIRPHGEEWRALMQAFGADASRTCDYDLEGVPIRAHQRHSYQCGCSDHKLTSRRHNKVLRGGIEYTCRQCGSRLVYQAEVNR